MNTLDSLYAAIDGIPASPTMKYAATILFGLGMAALASATGTTIAQWWLR